MSEQPIQVLVVDDETSLREPLAKYLRSQNFEVQTAATYREAIQRVQDEHALFDVALVDNLLIPDIDEDPEPLGIQLMNEIRTLAPNMEFILVSGWDRESGLDALRAGAFRYLSKPFDHEELIWLITAAGEQARTRRERDIFSAIVEISKQITLGLEKEATLNKIVELVPSLVEADICTVVLCDQQSGKLQNARSNNIHDPDKRWTRHLKNRFLTQGIIETGRAYQEVQVNTRPDMDEQFRNSGVQAFIGIPIPGKNGNIGVLYTYRLQPRSFGNYEHQILTLLAEQAAIALENARLHEEVVKEKDRSKWMNAQLLALQEIAAEIQSPRELPELLNTISRLATDLLDADSGCILLLENEHLTIQGAYGLGAKVIQGTREILGENIAGRVAKNGQSMIANHLPHNPDFKNPAAEDEGLLAVMSTPLQIGETIIGTLDVHSRSQREAFTGEGLQILSLMANHAALAIMNVRYLKEVQAGSDTLRSLYNASSAILSTMDPNTLMQRVVWVAKDALRAWRIRIVLMEDSSVSKELVQIGFENSQNPTNKVRAGGISTRVFSSGEIVCIEDVLHTEENINPSLKEDAVGASACIPLQLRGASIGVMWVDYPKPRPFSELEKEAMMLYANQAAIAYDNATLASNQADLLNQLRQTRDAAQVVADLTVSVDLEQTLESVADNIYKILNCDAITIYIYEEDKETITSSPVMRGVQYKEKLTELEEVPKDSIVMKIMQHDEPDIVPDTTQDIRYANLRFVYEEKIISCIAIPLRIRERPLGVMFINYRKPHTFTDDELTTIKLLTDQAKAAVYNAQLYRNVSERAGTLAALNESVQIISSSLNLNEIFDTIVKQAKWLTGLYGPQASVSYLALREGNTLIPQSADPSRVLEPIRKLRLNIDLQDDDMPLGISAKALLDKESQLEGNVKALPHYVEFDPNTLSELAVPIMVDNHAIGVINVEHPEKNAFDKEDEKALQVLAAQASVAIQKAEQYQKLERQHQYQEAILAASKVISTGIARSQQELLDAILEQVVQRIQLVSGRQTILGVFQLYDPTKNEWWVGSVYPRKMNANLVQTIGDRNTLDRDKNKIGIAGRTILEQKPQRVGDVDFDDDYIQSCETTCSQLSVPLLDGVQVKGVLTLESDESDAFDETDESALQSLAELSVVAMKNAQQYQELDEARGRIEAATAIAWMGMISSTWRHSIGNDATTIQDLVTLAKQDIQSGDRLNRLSERLIKIYEMAGKIRDTPVTAPLSAEEGISAVRVNEFLGERIQRLWKYDPYKNFSLPYFDFELGHDATVSISPEWFRQVVDTLIDNAVEAMADSEMREITICTRYVNNGIAIFVKDTGPGIPEHIATHFLKDRVEKEAGEKGLGIGLLIAQMIVNTYGGRIDLEKSDPSGTVMCIWLPQKDSV